MSKWCEKLALGPDSITAIIRFYVGRFLSIAAIIGIFGPSAATAGGTYLNEFATPSMGVAGAGQEAYANDASTSFALHNPAGMTRLDGHELSAGAGLLYGKTEFDPDANTQFSGGDGGNQASLAPVVGTFGVISLTEDLKLGLSVFSLTGASLDPDDDWAGRYEMQEISLLTVTANPSLAYRINNWLSIGAGLTVMYADLEYKLAAPAVNPPAGGNSRVKIDGDDWAFGYNFGVLFEPSPHTRLGVTYVSKVEPEFDGDLDVRLGGGPAFTASSKTKLTFPQLVRAGVYHELNQNWALLGSIGWENWSDFDSFDISTSTGGNSIDTEWKDTYHFSAGIHYRPTQDWLLQTGFTYDTSPVSNKDRESWLPSDRQIRLAIGAQHQMTETLKIGGALEYIDLGESKIRSDTLRGDYTDNRAIAVSLNMNYKF